MLQNSMFLRLVVATGISLALTTSVRANDWTRFQFRITDDAPIGRLPLAWSPESHRLWTSEITGYGQSSPVTWKNYVFVTSISGSQKEQCHITAFDFESGKKLWQHDFAAATQAENSNYISKAAPTPVVDAAGIYCFFEGGNLLSLTHGGEVRWQRNLVEEFGEITSRHGLSASLEQTASHIFVWVERQKEPYVLAVDKTSGKDTWKVAGMGATSWASPRLINIAGGQHLVLSAIGSVTGLDPASGERLWRLEGISGNSSPTPVPAGENQFLVAATAGRGEADSGKSAAASNGLVEVKRKDDGTFQADYVWRSKRATSSFGSPAVHRGLAYFVNATGVLFCLDLQTGEERYSQRLADSIWATPIPAGDHILFCGKGGTVSIIAAGPEFQKLAENATWDAPKDAAEPAAERGAMTGGPVLYAGALVNDRLLLRRGDRLYCVGSADK